MRTVGAILFVFVVVSCFAQDEATFNVSKKKKVYIACKSDTLAGNSIYYFKVYGVSTKDIIPGKFSGGEVWLNDTAVCIHTSGNTSSTKKYLLELFLKKNTSEIFSRNFTIIPKVKVAEFNPAVARFINRQPDIFLGIAYYYGTFNWKKDSVEINLYDLLGRLKPTSISNSKITIKLKASFICDAAKQDLLSNSLILTPEIREKVKGIKKGCSIILTVDYHSFSDPPEDESAEFKINVK